MIKLSLIAVAVLAASATGASAYYYNGQHHPRHPGIGRHGHVIGLGPQTRLHSGRFVRNYQNFQIQQDIRDGAYARGH